jgi:hypothetical protein
VTIETAQNSTREPKEFKKDPIKASRRRQQRTRIVFVSCGLAVLVCTSLLLVFSFSSFQKTVESSDQIMMVSASHLTQIDSSRQSYESQLTSLFFAKASQDIVDQVKSTVKTVESAVDYANETISNTQLNLQTVCPNYVTAEALGVNFDELAAILKEKFEMLETMGTVNMTQINRTLATVQNGLDRVRNATETTEQKMWVFPFVLLVVFITIIAMLVAAVLAWTGKSSSRFERKVAYGVLPFLIIVAFVCWLLALGAAIASLVTSGKNAGWHEEEYFLPFPVG